EVAAYGLERRQLQLRLGAGWLGLGFRDHVDEHLEAAKRAGDVERLKRLRMEFTERAENNLRAELDRAGTARVIPGRATSFDLQTINRRTGCFERRKGICLGVEHANGRSIASPVAALPFDTRGATANATSNA